MTNETVIGRDIDPLLVNGRNTESQEDTFYYRNLDLETPEKVGMIRY